MNLPINIIHSIMSRTLVLAILLIYTCEFGVRANEDDLVPDFLQPLRPLGKCVSSEDCGDAKCVVVGMQRYSEPRCEDFGLEGSHCIVGAHSENKTLAYPDKILMCQEVYTLFCPCGPGLVCKQAKCQRVHKGLVRYSGRIRELPFERLRDHHKPIGRF